MSQLHTGKISLITLTFQLHLLSHIMESSCLDVCCFRMQIPFLGVGAMGPWCSIPASYLPLIPKPMEGSYHCPHFADKKTETGAGLNEM